MSKFEFWTIAYRARSGKDTILDNKSRPFKKIPNTWRYWAADPHLISWNEKTFVFAELYDRIARKGVIGYSELSAEGATPWKVVLRQHGHLSYPHLLRRGEEIYMIPESYVAGEVSVFRAKRFPDEWEKAGILKKDWVAVDSTVFRHGGKRWLLTLQFENNHEYLTLFELEEHGLQGEGLRICQDDPNVRPAGGLFERDGILLRPAQDCSESYGCALNFYQVQKVSAREYRETLICKVRPEEIVSDLGKKAAGLHTYNFDEKYEVIDLKTYENDVFFWPMRVVWFVWRRVRRLFGG